MNTHPALEKAETYLNLHVSRTGPGFTPSPEGPFVTISRESGAGGSSLAHAIARRLEAATDTANPQGIQAWTVYNSSIIDSMLKTNQLAPSLSRYLPEDSISEIHASVGELVGLHPSLWELVQKTGDLMRKLARQGRVILVGRGANFATSGIRNGIHLRLVAPPDHRARHMAQVYQMGYDEALSHNAKRDAARRRYVRSVFNADIGDTSAYDMVLNTARMPISDTADLIAGLLRARQSLAAVA